MLQSSKRDNVNTFVRAIVKLDGERIAEFSDLRRARQYVDRFAPSYTDQKSGEQVRQDVKLVKVVNR